MADISVSFDIYDAEAVRILQEEDPDLLPDYSVNAGKDLAYNKKQVTNAITSGIIKGESIPKIASNLQSTMKNLNQRSAIGAARTAATSAHNAGKLSTMKELAAMGVEVQKEWVATLDDRTRESHRKLDGERRDLDERFSNGLMYPGASGSSKETWRCRCTMVSYIPDIDTSDASRWSRNPDTGKREYVSNITYDEWIKTKSSKGSAVKKTTSIKRILTKEELVSKIKAMADSGEYIDSDFKWENLGDLSRVRATTNSLLGYDALPEVLNANDFDVATKGLQVLYRGVRDSTGQTSWLTEASSEFTKTAGEIVEQFKHGDLWTGNTGNAAYGNGVYFSSDQSVASDYARAEGRIIKAAIKADAKIISYNDACKLFENDVFNDAIQETSSMTVKEQILSGWLQNSPDIGQYAAIKGYDVIEAWNHEYVVLNRGALIVEE